MDFNLSELINHGITQEVLLAIIALFLKSAVKLLHKIHSVFINIESKLTNVVTQNDRIIEQNKEINNKVTVIRAEQEQKIVSARRAKKAAVA
jgi:hypothetical protein